MPHTILRGPETAQPKKVLRMPVKPTMPPKQKSHEQLLSAAMLEARKPAVVNLKVDDTGFHDMNSTTGAVEFKLLSKFEMSVEDHGRVEVRANGTKLNIKPGGATLRFHVQGKTGGGRYHPVGIAFLQTKGNLGHRLGHDVFEREQIRVTEDYLEVTDCYEHLENEAPHEYEFSLVVQHGDHGWIGIIDPPITHDY